MDNYLSYDDCLEDKREDYQNCAVLCIPQYCILGYMHTHMSSSYEWTRACWFRQSFFLLTPATVAGVKCLAAPVCAFVCMQRNSKMNDIE